MRFPFLTYAIKGLFSKPVTEKYPFVLKEAPEGYRGRIEYDPEKCIGCGMCVRVCSPGAITLTKGEKTEEGEKITLKFQLSSCTFCKLCADFCPKKAIKLTKDYSMAVTNVEDLNVSGSFIKKLPQKPAASGEK